MATMTEIDNARDDAKFLLDRARESGIPEETRLARREQYQSQIDYISALLHEYHNAVDKAAREAAQKTTEALR